MLSIIWLLLLMLILSEYTNIRLNIYEYYRMDKHRTYKRDDIKTEPFRIKNTELVLETLACILKHLTSRNSYSPEG